MKKRIFVDTNVLLDVLLEREGFYYDALKIWAAAEEGKVDAHIAAISVNNVHYVVKRLKSETTAMIAVRIVLRIIGFPDIQNLLQDPQDRDRSFVVFVLPHPFCFAQTLPPKPMQSFMRYIRTY